MSNNKLYQKSRVSNEAQQRVLDLNREGKDPLEISRIVRMYLPQVNAIIENVVVTLRSVRGRKRCGCGALLVAEPCLSCQLAGVAS
jgi:hypothetical protein